MPTDWRAEKCGFLAQEIWQYLPDGDVTVCMQMPIYESYIRNNLLSTSHFQNASIALQ